MITIASDTAAIDTTNNSTIYTSTSTTTTLLDIPELPLRIIASHLSAVDLIHLRITFKKHSSFRNKQIKAETFIATGYARLFWYCSASVNEDARLGLGDTVDRLVLTQVLLPFYLNEGIAQVIVEDWNTVGISELRV